MNKAVDPSDNASHMFERLVFFSDAVFAIAITLLVLDLRLPPGSSTGVGLSMMGPQFEGYIVSFFVIALYWLSHHRLFGTLMCDDARVRVVNLLFLASVAFLPFPTKVIAEAPTDSAAVIFYASSAGLVGVLLAVLICVARQPGLMRAGETRRGTYRLMLVACAAPLVFLISTVVAVFQPHWAERFWILIIPAKFLGRQIGNRIDIRVVAPRSG